MSKNLTLYKYVKSTVKVPLGGMMTFDFLD